MKNNRALLFGLSTMALLSIPTTSLAAAIDVAECRGMAILDGGTAATEARVNFKPRNCASIPSCGLVLDGGKCARDRETKIKNCLSQNSHGADKVSNAAYNQAYDTSYNKCIKDAAKTN